MLAHLTAGIIRDADKSSTTASSGSLAPASRRVDSASGYRFPDGTEIERSEPSPRTVGNVYKIHLARFSGIDVERVTIYVSPFLHGKKEEERP